MAKKCYDYPACKELITHTCVFYAKWYARFILKYPLLHEMMEKRTNIYKKERVTDSNPHLLNAKGSLSSIRILKFR